MSATESSRQYPAVCPHCRQVKGYPFQVRTMNDDRRGIEVKLRCRECNQEWVEFISNPD